MTRKNTKSQAIDSKEMAVIISELSYEIDSENEEFILTYHWTNPETKKEWFIDKNHWLLKSNDRLNKLCECWFRAYKKSNSTRAIFGGLIPTLIEEWFITENFIKTSY